MKKQYKWGIALIFLVLILSLKSNIEHSLALDHSRKLCINHIYHHLVRISSNLGQLIENYNENGESDFHQGLETVAADFIQIDTIISTYNFNSKTPVFARGKLSFEFIAKTLGHGSSKVNDIEIQSILNDEVLTENEILYLSLLKRDIDLMIETMLSETNPPQEDENISIGKLNNILKEFFEIWANRHENSPYLLLE